MRPGVVIGKERIDIMSGITMTDIANELGLSVSTVSRALNGGQVRNSTRSAVLDYAARNAYDKIPTAVAAKSTHSQRKQERLSIGVLVTDLGGYYFNDLLAGIFSYANASGFDVFISDIDGAAGRDDALTALRNRSDGLIVVSSRWSEQELAATFDPNTTVLVSRTCDGFSSAIVDDESGIEQCVCHLASFGHRRIAYLGAFEHSFTNRRRRESFERAVQRYNLEGVVLGPFEPLHTGGVNAADELLLDADVTGVVAFNDLMAAGVLGRLMERGKRVPEDISVIGVDDSVLASSMRPALTSVSIRHERLGTAAVRLLTQRLRGARSERGSQPKCVVVPEILMVRGSTGAAPSALTSPNIL